jgi:hypothetical protein
MTKSILLAAVAMLSLSTVSAEARDRWHLPRFSAWEERPVYFYQDDEDDTAYYEPDDFVEEDVVVPRRYRNREQRMRDAEKQIDDRLWWLENNARAKLEERHKTRKKYVARVEPVAKPKAKVVAVTKPKKINPDTVQTASLGKPVDVVKPKAKAVVGKTIGCTAGAAVVTGYGFAEVKPKVCTGNTYAYFAARGGKSYEIRLAAASGEITDVKKLN